MDTRELGQLGERLACEYLVDNGYNILGKNWRIKLGEIDIIAQKKSPFWRFFLRNNNPVCFVEVKTIVNNRNFFPEEKVDFRKQRKLKQLAEIWLVKNKFAQDYPYQIDIAGILVNTTTQKATVHYFSNTVQET